MDLFDPWATRLGIETDSCYFLLPAAQRVRAIRSDITALKEFKLNVINYFGASPLPSHSYLEALALGGTVIVFGESWKPQAVEEVRMLATEKLFFFFKHGSNEERDVPVTCGCYFQPFWTVFLHPHNGHVHLHQLPWPQMSVCTSSFPPFHDPNTRVDGRTCETCGCKDADTTRVVTCSLFFFSFDRTSPFLKSRRVPAL